MPTPVAFIPLLPLSTRRPCPLAALSRPRRHHLRRRIIACLPTRVTDARGFVLPQEGDVVLYAGRWAGEDALGLVSNIRFVESRNSHVVDVIHLRRVAPDLFAVPRSPVKRRDAARWLDVAEVRVASHAAYVPAQDAYEVTGTNDGYAQVKPMDEEAKSRAVEEYTQLKKELLSETLLAGAVGTVAAAVGAGLHSAAAFGLGAASSAVYLVMLQAGVDAVGKGGLTSRLLALRFLVPVLPFFALGVSGGALAGGADSLVGSVSKRDALAVLLGLLTYKVPLFRRTGSEFVDGLADFEMGKTGMVGTVVGLAARQVKKRRDGTLLDEDDDAEVPFKMRPVIVFAGPSGAGKSTLIHRLLDEYPERFDYSVSHTTRERREGEQDGVDYNFVDTKTFEGMIENEAFVEHAQVHRYYYGTSYQAVNAVLSEGNICILDLDIQGVEELRKKSGLEWDARYVWIAPPSIDALEQRLRKRETETDKTLKTRLDTAIREIAYAATNNVFDLTVINKNVDEAYEELRQYLNRELPPQ